MRVRNCEKRHWRLGRGQMLQVAPTVDGTPAVRGELDLLTVTAFGAFLADLDGNSHVD